MMRLYQLPLTTKCLWMKNSNVNVAQRRGVNLLKLNWMEEKNHHKNSLPQVMCQVIEPNYKDLSNKTLLKRCLRGRTQNPNESFCAAIWKRLPKTVCIGLETLKFGVLDEVIHFKKAQWEKIMCWKGYNSLQESTRF